MREPVALEMQCSRWTIDMIRHGSHLQMYRKGRLRSFISRASGGAKSYASDVRDSPGAFWRRRVTSHSVLIASYTQAAILLCIVGQELHDHHSPDCQRQEKH